jgi:hypothetical protein
MALGATARDVRRLVLRQTLGMIAVGTASGSVGAWVGGARRSCTRRTLSPSASRMHIEQLECRCDQPYAIVHNVRTTQ